MFKNLGTEFKVGLFTIVAFGTLGYMLFVLNPSALKNDKMVTYYTVLKDASGIIPKTHVKTNGVSIGKVKSVDLETNSTRILLEVEADVKIPVGSNVEVRTRGLLGDTFIEIVRADDSGKFIEAGGFIPKSDSVMDLQAVIALVGDIGKDVKKVTGTLANVLGTDQGEKSLKEVLENIQTLTADLRKTGATIRASIGDREKDVQDIVTNIHSVTTDLKSFAANLKDVLDDENKERINRIIASFDESMVDVKGATKNIRLIAEKVEKGEGTLGKLVNDDTVIEEIKGAVKDIREVISPATKLQIAVDAHLEGRRDKSAQSYFDMMFKTRPDRYYLIGITDVNESVRETEEEPIPTEPGRTKTRETTVERKSLRFNLQMAKRWYFASLRFGLFETTGGVAGDLHFFTDRLRFTVEAFDWKTRDNEIRRVAHVKSYVSILFFNHLYAMFGVDDITRTKDPKTREEVKQPNVFAGAGIRFNDQDLKAIFGAAALAM